MMDNRRRLIFDTVEQIEQIEKKRINITECADFLMNTGKKKYWNCQNSLKDT